MEDILEPVLCNLIIQSYEGEFDDHGWYVSRELIFYLSAADLYLQLCWQRSRKI